MQFERAVQTLADAGVEFVIIGGLAATLHGSAQVTYDLDICYSRTAANQRRLTAALSPFHSRLRDIPGTIFTLQTDLGEIDLLAEVAGLGDFDVVKRHSIVVEVFQRQIAALDLPALIRAKRAAGRANDLSALVELEGLLEAGEQ